MSDRVHTCPVCGGCGTVPHDFYNRHGMSTSTARESCRSCLGRGIIVAQEPPADPRDKRFLPKYGKEGPPLPKRIVIGRNGAYWRDYGDGQGYSMAVVSTDNDPVEEFAVYVRQRPEPIACAVCHGAGHNIRGGKLVNCDDCLGSGRPQEPPAKGDDRDE